MIQHKFSNACSPPFRVCKYEGNVGFIVGNIRHHKGKSYYNLPEKDKGNVGLNIGNIRHHKGKTYYNLSEKDKGNVGLF
jgi:hypothetical protein